MIFTYCFVLGMCERTKIWQTMVSFTSLHIETFRDQPIKLTFSQQTACEVVNH